MKHIYLLSILGIVISMEKATLPAKTVKELSGKSAMKRNPKKTASEGAQFINASNSGDLKKVTKLIRIVDPNYQNRSKKTALYLAASNGHVDVVAYLLAHGANPNIRDSDGKTALDAARKSTADSREKVIALLKASVRAKTNASQVATAVKSSTSSKNATQSSSNQSVASISSDIQPAEKSNPKERDLLSLAYDLLIAADSGELNEVKELLKLGVDPNFQKYANKQTALHLASLNGHADVVEYLLAHGADPSIADSKGSSALDEAKKSTAGSRARVIALLSTQVPSIEKDTDNTETTDRSSTSSSSSATNSNASSTPSPRIKISIAPASVIEEDPLLSTHQRCVVQPFFSPDDHLSTRLIRLIDAEKKRISIAIFKLTDKAITEALIRAARRGVLVEGVVDRSYGQEVCMLANAKIPLWVFQTASNKSEAGLMHNKFMLFSQTIEGKALVWTGSYNLTMRANEKNQENVVIIENEDLFEAYTKSFERLKKRSLQLSGRC